MADHRILVEISQQKGVKSSAPGSVPSNDTATAPDKDSATNTLGVSQIVAMARNPLGAAKSAVTTAFPWAAAVIAAAIVADKVITTANDFASAESGDYRAKMEYDNFKTRLGLAMNPLTFVSGLKQDQSVSLANRTIAQQRVLMGEADVNGQTKKGVR